MLCYNYAGRRWVCFAGWLALLQYDLYPYPALTAFVMLPTQNARHFGTAWYSMMINHSVSCDTLGGREVLCLYIRERKYTVAHFDLIGREKVRKRKNLQ